MSSRQSPTNYHNYCWVDGFKDFFNFIKERPVFTLTFIVFHSFIAYTLVGSFNSRIEKFQEAYCPQFENHTDQYFNGRDWLPNPSGDLDSIYQQIIGKVRSHKTLLIEDLALIAEPATLEQAEAAIQIKHEYIIHPYRAVVPCQPKIKSNDGFLTVALMYVIGFAIFLVYMTSPYGKRN